MKNLKLIVILIAVANNCIAQDTKYSQNLNMDCREKMMVGLKAGMNFSSVIGTEGQNFNANYIHGFAGGGFINAPFGKIFGIQAEVLYSEKGFQANGNMLGINYAFTRATSFIDVPVFFAYMPCKYFTLLVGPQYSYLIKQGNIFTKGSTNNFQESALNADNSRKNNLGFVLGFDIIFKNIIFGARTGWELEDNNGSGSALTPNYKNIWYQTTIGYRFNIRNVCGNDETRNY